MAVIKKTKVLNAGVILIAAVTLCTAYEVQIAENNAYMGYLPGIFTLTSISSLVLMVFGVIVVVPEKVQRPSDFFLLFYAVIVLLSCGLFSQVTGVLSGFSSLLLFLVLFIPVGTVFLFRKVSFVVNFNGVFDKDIIFYSLVVVIAIAVIIGAVTGTDSGFGWDSMYARRLTGRDNFGSRNITAYLLSMSMNGFGPFLAFVGALRRRISLIFCGLFVGVFSFWLLGLKGPFVTVLLFIALGHYLRIGRLTRFPTYFVLLIAVIGMLALGEVMIYDHSLIAEYILRRVFVVQAAVQTYYFDLIASSFNNSLSEVFFGIESLPYDSVTFFIGANYLDNTLANANTNAFLYALASGGVMLFVFASVFVGAFFAFIDRYYNAMNRIDVFFVGAVYAILLTEQAFTTAFISSGVGAVLLAILLMRKSKSELATVQTRGIKGRRSYG